MSRILKALILFFLFSKAVFASPANVQSVNRRTAVRCLKVAENFLSSKDYGNALAQSELGLAYDDSVADLWYVRAAAKTGLEEPKADILPLVMKAMTEGEWVDYNRDGARILYADLLCETGSYAQAIAILDAKPFLYSSDAEFIRIKSYYCMRTAESIVKARDKVNSARKIYPADTRFPHVFFKYEYDLHRNSFLDELNLNESSEILVQKIADSFIAKMPEYDNPDAELEIFSASFATGDRQKRMVQAFAAHGMKHPLYAMLALKCGLIDQQEAWDYFCSFADTAVSLSMLEDFLPLVTDEVTLESVREHLCVFGGILSVDTDFDCNGNLFVKYFRGRPQNFYWDENNDGVNEWSVNCDFGVPEEIHVTQGNINLVYGTYPAVVKAIYKSNRIARDFATFNIMDETLKWSPVDIKPLEVAEKIVGIKFFVPFVDEGIPDLNENMILYNCSNYEIASNERPDAKIVFSVMNGFPQSADYYSMSSLYAHALFEDGFPSIRSIDNDGDGMFETLETFGYDPENKLNRNNSEQEQIMTNLFGLPVSGSGIYLKMVQVDYNGDTVPDFTEEFLEGDGKISSWDYDGDGNWDVRYKRFPKEKADDSIVEDSQFYSNLDENLVTVTTWNGSPVKVQSGNNFYPVFQGNSKDFYWVEKEGSIDDETFVLSEIQPSLEQGRSVLLENKSGRIDCVKIGEKLFAYILPDDKIVEIRSLEENILESQSRNDADADETAEVKN